MKREYAVLAVAVLLCCAATGALAQAGPFGVGAPEPAVGGQGGIFAWIAARQAELYRTMSGAVRAFRENGGGGFFLIGISLLYGILHAAGPGHGKAVITGYLVATRQSARRGVLLSFVSSFVQALTAITLVGVFTLALNATSVQMAGATQVIEIVSYGLIAAIGGWLVLSKGRALLRELVPQEGALAAAGGNLSAHEHHHHHGHDGCCTHGPEPAQLAGDLSLRKAAAAVAAVGLRPCTGAVLVLVFAASQGVFALGVAAAFAMALGTGITVAVLAGLAVGARGLAARLAETGGGWAATALRAVEMLAALAVLAMGILLLGAALSG